MTSKISFAHLWQQDHLSDLELVLTATAQQLQQQEEDAATAQHRPDKVLQRLSAHCAILSSSLFFSVQIARWNRKRPHTDAGVDDGTACCSSAESSGRRQLVLTLQHEDQEPAAVAVLSSLYLVKPLPELLSELPQEQQLHAALLADMWQVPDVTTAAVRLLMKAAKTNTGLSPGFTKLYLGHEALPDCLLPILASVVAAVLQPSQEPDQQVTAQVKPLLLRVLGDLEGVWADAALQDILLKLPLPAMELLLGCDELKVASEDTVLYTAYKYVQAVPSHRSGLNTASRKPAKQKLAPLIRCPYLSSFWVSALAVSADAPKLLLSEQQEEVKQLLLLQQADPAFRPTAAGLQSLLPGSPSSWLLPKRLSSQVSSVQMVWMLDVEAVRAPARKGASQRDSTDLCSDCATPPLGGVVFEMLLEVQWDAAKGGSRVRLYVAPQNVPQDAFIKYGCSCSIPNRILGNASSKMALSVQRRCPTYYPFGDFFGLDTMAGGWDEAAWAAKGLPTSGQLRITLTVHGVGHCARSAS